MAYDLEEQEQIAQLKAFWQQWGKLIVGIVLVGVLAFVGYKGYEWYQKRQVAQAQAAFSAFNGTLAKKGDATAQLNGLQNNFAKTNYASLASLQMAAALAGEGKFEQAQAPLQWVLQHGQLENQGAARLHLADVLMQLNKKDEALKVLDTPEAHFEAAFANKKADIYLMGQDAAKAREIVQSALDQAKKATPVDVVAVEALEQKLKFLP
jgi:predicted negative regulator of RcsB-dependent stress response